MNIPLLEPSAVTFLTTFRCTAACENCCFQCSPHPSKSMTFLEMKKYLDICLAKYPHIKLVVFSGGECTLLKQDLTDMISYASSMGIRTRIVTNAWWAKSYRDATIKIKLLKAAGLDEINFSTGDEHQEWVPFRYVRNAAVAVEAFVVIGTTTWVTHVHQHTHHDLDNNRMLEVWELKNGQTDYVASNKINNAIVEEGMGIIKNNFPEVYSTVDEDVLKSVILLNVSKNMPYEE